ncbi:MFS transporter [Streptomyces sp. LP05-1]|uniref:MFS transporter n=1 Tax=Streptomyces pyxinae TaxID=2970734 RepID=A0ABT2CKI8_9ACTN|nr:MFS transporter [Streptomyces sp. LP05-1]MCS0637592.1 MFS transporter [Streptomyces sp. LP05-1]
MPAVETTSTPARRRLGPPLLVLATAQLVISLDYSIVYVALPGIGSGLGFSGQDLQWVVSAYVVATGGLLLLGGRATDLLGRRRIFVIAALLYAVSSLVGGASGSPGLLIAVRAVQGIGGALLFPAALSLINTLYEEGPDRNRALAVWGAAGAGGLCFGSLLGGVLVEAFGWPAVFYVNVPLAGGTALAGALLFPADRPPPGRRDFDLPGALTATVGITLLVFVLIHAPEAGWGSPGILGCAVLSVLSLALFALAERRARAPLTPGHLYGRRGLLGAMALAALFSATFSALPYFLTLYFQTVRGYGALATGAAFLVPAVVVAVGTKAGERAVSAFGVRPVLPGALAVGAAGAVLLAAGLGGEGPYLRLLPGLVLLSLGQGATWTALWIAAASGIPARDQGVASGLASTALQVGGAVGLAVLIVVVGAGDHGAATATPAGAVRDAVWIIAAGIAAGACALLPLRHRAAR